MKKPIKSFNQVVEASKTTMSSKIQDKFEDEPKRLVAQQALEYSHEYIRGMPIGWNQGYRIKDLNDKISKYVEKRMRDEQPKGFLFGGEILLAWIVSGIISWVIRRFLDSILDRFSEHS